MKKLNQRETYIIAVLEKKIININLPRLEIYYYRRPTT